MTRTSGHVLSGEGHTINLKIFPTHDGIYKLERKFNKNSGERKKLLGSLQKYGRMYPWG